ncbi:GspH/FimT family pseudopilin [Wenzhouxiangella sediminis]|uniref:GspH/FimT family pseudopilin n=1 Tax=Wenzhouxiangella sediminis TaxID=1792836 RepID=UPI0015F28C9C|nr:GspH/FimT family pseudopilin [Wenzhouxiangella sediminis]
MSKRDCSGFTIIELMIAISLLAVILTLAVPAFGRFIEQQQLTATANRLVGHLQFARGQAITRGTLVAACPSRDGRTCTGGNRWEQGWIVYLDPEKAGQPAEGGDVLRVVQAMPEHVMHSGGRHRVRFKDSGMAYGTNLTIRICSRGNPEAARAVIVSNPGRVRATREVDPAECGG